MCGGMCQKHRYRERRSTCRSYIQNKKGGTKMEIQMGDWLIAKDTRKGKDKEFEL